MRIMNENILPTQLKSTEKGKPFSLVVPCATVFLSSFCIMVIELVAARLIARHLGSSLYTWTAMIGVVLAGITIGNYFGGRIADRYGSRVLAPLFVISAASCVAAVILNYVVGEWSWLWHFSWPARVFSHVFAVFILPSTLLGTISPVVAKMALDQGLATGRTVGNIYAWGAAGSIAGTFATGYVLISAFGTVAIIWAVATLLMLMGVLYGLRRRVFHVALALFLVVLAFALGPWNWAKEAGASILLRKAQQPGIVYEAETAYGYVAVKRTAVEPEIRQFHQDKLVHSSLRMDDISKLQYEYQQIHAAVTKRLAQNKRKLSTLSIGGGGYVFPRYVLDRWPGSSVDVAEIDPGVTEAAMVAFGLPRDTPIRTITMDARNYIDSLIHSESTGEATRRYDFIYADAFNHHSVPYQLTTKEFNDSVAELLKPDGVYMINLIDIFSGGEFLGPYFATLEQTFDHVVVIDEEGPDTTRKTFVLVASKKSLNLHGLNTEAPAQDLRIRVFSEKRKKALREKAGGILLTDDYAPVDNLLAPVARRAAVAVWTEMIEEEARGFFDAGNFDESISKYQELLELSPEWWAVDAYTKIGFMLAQQGKPEDSVRIYREVLEFNDEAELKENVHHIHLSLGIALQRMAQHEEAREHLQLAVDGYEKEVLDKPRSRPPLEQLGDTYAALASWSEAAEVFAKTLTLDPANMTNQLKASQSLEAEGRYQEAIASIERGIAAMSQRDRREEAAQLREYLAMVKSRQPE